MSPIFQIKPRQQRLVRRGAETAVVLGQRRLP